MKRSLLFFVVLFGLCGLIKAQLPSCQNDNALSNRIQAIENQGWVEIGREFQPYLYFTVPEPPFIIGELSVTFAVQCDPGEACPKILMLHVEKAVATSNNACHWQPLVP